MISPRSFSAFFAALLISLLVVSVARADKFLMRDGTTIDGDVVSDNDATVTIEQSAPFSGVTLSRKLDKAQVQTWYRSSRDGPAYVVIPIFGAVGEDVTASSISAALAEARMVKPRYVVLAIDSPGGSIGEMFHILDALWEKRDEFQVVAYVKNAYSAAAVIAMSCPFVYLKPGGAIGAAVPFRVTENGPADIEAKFRSVIEAGMRAANAHGGHPDLLMRAMNEMDLELFLTQENGRPTLSATGPGKQIKFKGQILTLTADEAAACGLSMVATDMNDVGADLVRGPWHEGSRRPWNAVISTMAAQKRAAREHEEKRQRQLARNAALKQIKPDMDAMTQRLITLDAKVQSINKELSDLTDKANAQMQQVQADYDLAIRRANASVNSRAETKKAKDTANAKAQQIEKSYEEAKNKAQAEIDAAKLEATALRQRQQQLMATVPGE
jgi:ATP-dependent protease ClpP protease subunit